MNLQEFFNEMLKPNAIFAGLMGGDGSMSRERALKQVSERIRIQSTGIRPSSCYWTHDNFEYIARMSHNLPFRIDSHSHAIRKSCRRRGFRTPWDGSLESAALPIAETVHSLPWKHLRADS